MSIVEKLAQIEKLVAEVKELIGAESVKPDAKPSAVLIPVKNFKELDRGDSVLLTQNCTNGAKAGHYVVARREHDHYRASLSVQLNKDINDTYGHWIDVDRMVELNAIFKVQA